MGVVKLSTAGIVNYQKYAGFLANNAAYVPPEDHELLESQILTSTATSVTFDNLNSTYGSTYQHLQVVWVSTRNTVVQGALWCEVNGDTNNSNYRYHVLYGSGSSVTSSSGQDRRLSNHVGVSPVFTTGITDILDAFETSKNKTFRTLSANTGSNEPFVALWSRVWLNTNAISSLAFKVDSDAFPIGTRFSLYGIR